MTREHFHAGVGDVVAAQIVFIAPDVAPADGAYILSVAVAEQAQIKRVKGRQVWCVKGRQVWCVKGRQVWCVKGGQVFITALAKYAERVGHTRLPIIC